MNLLNNIFIWNELSIKEQKNLLKRPNCSDSANMKAVVKKIINNIKIGGDREIANYTNIFDHQIIQNSRVSEENISNSIRHVSKNFKNAISVAKQNITAFHLLQITQPIDIETQPGIRCQQIVVPLNTVGLYVPGGSSASLVSSVLMLAIPAFIAGCKKIVLCSPPPVSKEILYASFVCGIHEIFQIGGVQAIAALAYGTETVPKVDKIFGPGNKYVAEAKLQVSSLMNSSIAIDMLAGPSEVLIIADEQSNPIFIASDLLAQAEHGIDSQVILLTTSLVLARSVITEINKQIIVLKRMDIIKKSLLHSRIIITKSLIESIKISNFYAPEHLILHSKLARQLLSEITNASSVFLGEWSPESCGDYASGSNHVLPTYGRAINGSGLNVSDFQKNIIIQELTEQGLVNLSPTVQILSDVEGMSAHSNAIQVRLDWLRKKKKVI